MEVKLNLGSILFWVKLELEPFYVLFKEQEAEVLHKNQELPKTVCKAPCQGYQDIGSLQE
jgi:hypothetical protein